MKNCLLTWYDDLIVLFRFGSFCHISLLSPPGKISLCRILPKGLWKIILWFRKEGHWYSPTDVLSFWCSIFDFMKYWYRANHSCWNDKEGFLLFCRLISQWLINLNIGVLCLSFNRCCLLWGREWCWATNFWKMPGKFWNGKTWSSLIWF